MTKSGTTESFEVCFLPAGLHAVVPGGTPLRDAARLLGVEIESLCGGRASCGKCLVRVLESEAGEDGLHSQAAHVSELSDAERRARAAGRLGDQERFSCQACVEGELVIYVPEASRVGRPIVRKRAGERECALAPAIRKYFVEIELATVGESRGDWDRLQEELCVRFGLDRNLAVDPLALRTLAEALRGGRGRLTVTVWQGREAIRFEPGFSERVLGLAVDLGTTTLGALLCDLQSGQVVAQASAHNPQIRWGEDIMNRIASAKPPGQLAAMQQAVAEAIGELARDATLAIDAKPDDVVEVVVVANTVMHHILLGLDVHSLGVVPFSPTLSRSLDVKARDLGIPILPSANVHLLPIEAGFVGADNVAAMLAAAPHVSEELTLLIDIGTNGELVLGNRDRLLSASCPTGPALEGANIRFGMRAARGAIEKIRVDPATHEVRFRTIGVPRWSDRQPPEEIGARGLCGSAVLEAVAELVRAGLIDSTGRLYSELPCRRLRQGTDGMWEFVIAWAEQTVIGEDITLTQADVRAIQLAKAALYAGSRLLLERFGAEQPDRVVLAGAFGSVIDLERALAIGLFPDCGLDNVTAVGNAAGDGARMALLNVTSRQEAELLARRVEYLELSTARGFNDAFVAATQLPHAEDRFPSTETRWSPKAAAG
ncbi:hypothetical protein ACG33_12645 [Steroidobacter denitrificans]|uniref:2Fe-2S ferredoxin-type domain-containing protein n=1 Tax=Steroidobacter denitrificans TaxID=465721 RepID=A0A127FDY9_STEDE|nr:ASKHA domain-containing protein [Steroidobacter denitrificans]AMN47931.1 hypothetical protein ACG33_12645 [Steroidobacter denitrificans]